MGDLIIHGPKIGTFTPDVRFSETEGKGFIKGESYQEDPFSFYSELSEWFDFYFKSNDTFELDIELTYINSSCSRALVDLLKQFKNFRDEGKSITVNWCYHADDEDMEMLEDGEDFMAASDFEMNFVER